MTDEKKASQPGLAPNDAKPGCYVDIAFNGPPVVAKPPTWVCPKCGEGRLENGVALLPYECCAIYFFGAGSLAHGMWRENARTPEERAIRRVVQDRIAAERIAAMEPRAMSPEDEKALRTRLMGLGRRELIEEIVTLRRPGLEVYSQGHPSDAPMAGAVDFGIGQMVTVESSDGLPKK